MTTLTEDEKKAKAANFPDTKGVNAAVTGEFIIGRADRLADLGLNDLIDTDSFDAAQFRDMLVAMFTHNGRTYRDLYVSVNLGKVRENDAPILDHTYFVMVNPERQRVIQSTDPHALHRVPNGEHEDAVSGTKHEVRTALALNYAIPDRTRKRWFDYLRT